MKNVKLILCSLIVILIFSNLTFGSNIYEDYKVLNRPFKIKIDHQKFPSKLIVQVRKDNRVSSKITILYRLVELFKDQNINFDRGKKIKMGKIIDILNKNPEKMVEMIEDDGDEILWIWLE